jgi:hypothetical protein
VTSKFLAVERARGVFRAHRPRYVDVALFRKPREGVDSEQVPQQARQAAVWRRARREA